MDHTAHQPLLATADAALAEELTRLSAAAGAAVEVASTAPDALGAWSTAPVVLVGADLVSALVELAPPRRPGVQVVAWSPAATGTFRDALLVGAERVVELPVGAELIAELLTDLEEVGRGEGVAGRCRGRFRWRWGDDAGLRARTGGVGPRTDPGRRPRPAGARMRPGARARRRTRRAVGLPRHGVRPAEWALAARGGAAPRRPGRAGVGFRSVRARRRRGPRGPLGGAPRPRHGGRRPTALGRPRGRDGRAVRARRGGRGADGHRCRRRGPVGRPRCPTRAGSGCWSGVAVPTRDGWPRSSAPRCVATMSDQRGLAEALDLGLGPVRSRRGPLAAAARELLAGLAPTALAA